MISSVDDVIADARLGRMFIILDDDDRENEGDLMILSEFVDVASVNLMIRSGTGIVCVALRQEFADRLTLGYMPRMNVGSDFTRFTVSVDARYNISTGVSAMDRVTTIKTLVDPSSTMEDIVTPGHVFPILADSAGLRARLGHTEAAVQISELAGAGGAVVMCELMNEDGTMSRLDDLVKFSRAHDIKISTIRLLIEHLGISG